MKTENASELKTELKNEIESDLEVLEKLSVGHQQDSGVPHLFAKLEAESEAKTFKPFEYWECHRFVHSL